MYIYIFTYVYVILYKNVLSIKQKFFIEFIKTLEVSWNYSCQTFAAPKKKEEYKKKRFI